MRGKRGGEGGMGKGWSVFTKLIGEINSGILLHNIVAIDNNFTLYISIKFIKRKEFEFFHNKEIVHIFRDKIHVF